MTTWEEVSPCDSMLISEYRNFLFLQRDRKALRCSVRQGGGKTEAKPSEKASSQPFRIYKITTPLTGLLEIAARHIQYQENFITVSPFSAIGSQTAIAELKKRATTDCPFSFWTDIDSKAVFSFTSPATIRSCLGGMDGSLLDTYGGEYEWDMFTTLLHAHRGADHGVRIVYGKKCHHRGASLLEALGRRHPDGTA